MYKPYSITDQKAEELGITPDDAEKMGYDSIKFLVNPFKDEGLLGRRWVSGWCKGFQDRRDKGTSSA